MEYRVIILRNFKSNIELSVWCQSANVVIALGYYIFIYEGEGVPYHKHTAKVVTMRNLYIKRNRFVVEVLTIPYNEPCWQNCLNITVSSRHGTQACMIHELNLRKATSTALFWMLTVWLVEGVYHAQAIAFVP